MLVSCLKYSVVSLQIPIPIIPMSRIWQWVGIYPIATMISNRVSSISMNCRVFVTNASICQYNDVILTITRIEYSIVVNIMVISFHHQATGCIPNYIVMHTAIYTGSNLVNRCIKSYAIFANIVNPVECYFRTWSFTLHYLNNRTVTL